ASPSRKGWSAVIVKTEGVPTAAQEAAIAALGGDIYRHLPIINSLAVRIPNRRLKQLAALPFVSRLSSDMEVKKTDEFTVAGSGASTAWNYGLSGTGIGVAVIDSGVDGAPDITTRIKGPNFVPDSSGYVNPTTVVDVCGHGTHIAGIIAGSGWLSSASYNFRTFKGIAPSARIIAVRVLDRQGSGTVSQVIAGIQWTVANRAANNIRVINLSLGHTVGESYKTDPLCQAVESAWKSGMVVVCAAGNNGRKNATQTVGASNEGWGTRYGAIQSPANSPYVITVGAMKPTAMQVPTAPGVPFVYDRTKDRIATYSSRGPSRLDYVVKPDLVAPGNRVISLYGTNNTNKLSEFPGNVIPVSTYTDTSKGQGKQTSSAYFMLSGTSMAAPVVAGAAALLLQKYPNLSPDAIKARLMFSADKCLSPDGTPDPFTYGAGYLNIPAALNNTALPSVYALSPSVSVDTTNCSLFLSPTLWSNRAIWGISGVWGSQAIWGEKATWGDQAIWGTQGIWGSQALWGEQLEWMDQAIWGSTTGVVDLTNTAILGEK
ncbi:S8 family peptidase, partial [Armatimonas sp.]|uniref:S8 family peptidase n=1 Tax=Armatimonas sp. TaxID=1872638 RepID=UPI00286B64CF